MSAHPHVVVIGAGAFGSWSALALLREGATVTLIDAWGPGHPRASSGGDTRIIRATYGPRRIYTRMAARALQLWREHDRQWGHGCLRASGALWMSSGDDRFARESEAALRDEGLAVEMLDSREAARRWPQVDFTDIRSVLYEPGAGFLFARQACQRVVNQFVSEGGTFRLGAARPAESATRVTLSDGTSLAADAVVYAAGPWLPALFPELLGHLITPTRQVVHYFGTPAGDGSFDAPQLPVWLDLGDAVMYGIPGGDHRGFKIADDTSGPPLDPTTGARTITPEDIARTRTYLARRFPRLADAPWIGGEVCQYESTPDSHFIIDTHPLSEHVWLVGGGSGHGFKMGPVIGEIVADAVLGDTGPDPAFSLHRFAAGLPDDRKW